MIRKKLADQEVVRNPARDRTWEETLGSNELRVIPKGECRGLDEGWPCGTVSLHRNGTVKNPVKAAGSTAVVAVIVKRPPLNVFVATGVQSAERARMTE